MEEKEEGKEREGEEERELFKKIQQYDNRLHSGILVLTVHLPPRKRLWLIDIRTYQSTSSIK